MTGGGLNLASLLPLIADRAQAADATRSISADVITAIKANPVMAMSASREMGGLESDMAAIGAEMEAASAACSSTAWCLWNHLGTFHFFCGLLGPANLDQLANVTKRGQWVCLPAGAGTGVRGQTRGEAVVLNGVAAFGSGARYADHAGVLFVPEGEKAPRFTLMPTLTPGLRIDPTWKAMSLRASATDHVYYEDAPVPTRRVVAFPKRSREVFRDPSFAVINPRYREDWVGLSDLWLGCMAVGLAQAALDDACAGIQGRRAIMGVAMVDRPTIHVNLGMAGALISAARAAVFYDLDQTDRRIARRETPTETDYLAQVAGGMIAVRQCDEAMRLILRVLGGNGLREGTTFERRYRDFQAMPLHINAHPDRVTEQYGRHLLGLPTENPF